MPPLCGLTKPTFNRRYMPLTRRASFSIGGGISWMPGPTRITYTDQADEISKLGCRDLRPDGVIAQYPTANLTLPQTDPYTSLCTGMLYFWDCYA
jgi:hypothetical protein